LTLFVFANTKKQAESMFEFSNRFSSILYGFESATHYYHSASAINHLSSDSIKLPLLVVNAKDDPLVPPNAIPVEKLKNNSSVVAVLTECGGHLGWLDWLGNNWFNRVAVEYIQALLKLQETKQ
jgi:predicted alpha/beta-fold hydrolase